jgi:hypothetical protein
LKAKIIDEILVTEISKDSTAAEIKKTANNNLEFGFIIFLD